MNDVNAQWSNLRRYFSKQAAKVRATKRSGAGTDKLFVSKLTYLSALDKFLGAAVIPRGSVSNMVKDCF